ncbi:NAD-binding protein [Halostella sp. PRR32]|uniref:NAD-binding protein n=1 Tax=Halostella sp. PRR32 TaxID=3098147 RepID=UPI002B1DCDED|nr:NAD-binding protein [Halostella sp. PRR32]
MAKNQQLPAGENERSAADSGIYVVGDDSIAIGLARKLADRTPTVFVSADDSFAEAAERADLDARRADVTDPWSLDTVGIRGADTVVAASRRDDRNILTAQIVRTRFDVDDVVVRLDDPTNSDAFDDIDVRTVCLTSVLANEIADQLTQ